MVELHSFVPTSSTAQKVANWGHLNRKVLSKLNLRLPEEMIQQLVQSRPGMAEQLLQLLREKIQERQRQRKVREFPGMGNSREWERPRKCWTLGFGATWDRGKCPWMGFKVAPKPNNPRILLWSQAGNILIEKGKFQGILKGLQESWNLGQGLEGQDTGNGRGEIGLGSWEGIPAWAGIPRFAVAAPGSLGMSKDGLDGI
uniref:CH-like domain-containing protein n=1 Tax=Ficedula albicollis TaxID=59894 RepID=A0A803WDB8_FICAL